MKKTLYAALLLLLALSLPRLCPAAQNVFWDELPKIATGREKPLAVAASFDKKRVFVLTDAGNVQVFAEDGKNLGSIPVGPRVTGIDVSVRGDQLYLAERESKTVRTLAIDFLAELDITASPFIGSPQAPVIIAEFSDFQCPYCSKMMPTLEKILEKNPGKVKIVFKHFPLPFHQFAEPAARAAIAAHLQGKFWQLHDLLFDNAKTLSAAKIQELAKEAGLDMNRFRRDMESDEVKKRLAADITDGRDAGINGTPSLFVNGRIVKGNSLADIQKRIDDALKGQGAGKKQ